MLRKPPSSSSHSWKKLNTRNDKHVKPYSVPRCPERYATFGSSMFHVQFRVVQDGMSHPVPLCSIFSSALSRTVCHIRFLYVQYSVPHCPERYVTSGSSMFNIQLRVVQNGMSHPVPLCSIFSSALSRTVCHIRFLYVQYSVPHCPERYVTSGSSMFNIQLRVVQNGMSHSVPLCLIFSSALSRMVCHIRFLYVPYSAPRCPGRYVTSGSSMFHIQLRVVKNGMSHPVPLCSIFSSALSRTVCHIRFLYVPYSVPFCPGRYVTFGSSMFHIQFRVAQDGMPHSVPLCSKFGFVSFWVTLQNRLKVNAVTLNFKRAVNMYGN